jgi:hypothetical protein
MYLTDKSVRDHRSASMFPDRELSARVELGLFLKGNSLRSGIQITLSQPMGNEHVDGFIEALEEVLAEED